MVPADSPVDPTSSNITLRGGGNAAGDAPPWAVVFPKESLSSNIQTAVHVPASTRMAPVDLHLGGAVDHDMAGSSLLWRLITGRALHMPSDMSMHGSSKLRNTVACFVGAHALSDRGMVAAISKAVANSIRAKYSSGHAISVGVYPFYAEFLAHLQVNGYDEEHTMVNASLVRFSALPLGTRLY